jgi:hypothetical protein
MGNAEWRMGNGESSAQRESQSLMGETTAGAKAVGRAGRQTAQVGKP